MLLNLFYSDNKMLVQIITKTKNRIVPIALIVISYVIYIFLILEKFNTHI